MQLFPVLQRRFGFSLKMAEYPVKSILPHLCNTRRLVHTHNVASNQFTIKQDRPRCANMHKSLLKQIKQEYSVKECLQISDTEEIGMRAMD